MNKERTLVLNEGWTVLTGHFIEEDEEKVEAAYTGYDTTTGAIEHSGQRNDAELANIARDFGNSTLVTPTSLS